MPERPTGDVAAVVLDSIDTMYEQLRDRLDGLTVEEYLWEPVAGMWSVRETDGVARAHPIDDRDADPAPVTTIAWRLWHIASDCFDSYTRRLRGEDDPVDLTWTIEPDEAVRRLDRAWSSYRAAISDRDPWALLGDSGGPYAQHSTADMALHAGNELVHHGAEIALLRDLYRAGFTR